MAGNYDPHLVEEETTGAQNASSEVPQLEPWSLGFFADLLIILVYLALSRCFVNIPVCEL